MNDQTHFGCKVRWLSRVHWMQMRNLCANNGMVGVDDDLWSTVTLGINWFDMRGHEMIYAQGMQ